jgi:hypothetical protein
LGRDDHRPTRDGKRRRHRFTPVGGFHPFTKPDEPASRWLSKRS